MYKVSDNYIAARRKPFIEERITGGIKLKDGTIIAVDDTVIVQGSLSTTRQAMSSSKFDIGTANAASMKLKIRDSRAYDHDFGGALIKLKYGIVTAVAEDGTKTWEEVPLPPFYVDGAKASRKRDVVALTAADPITRLAVDKGSPPTTSLYAALQYFCNRCGVGVAVSESEFNALPNASVIPDFSAESVATCWDGVMWIAQTVGCCAFGDYRGLVQLKQYKYEGGNTYDRLFTANERKSIEYSDTRTYLAYLQSYVENDVKNYSKVVTWTGTDAPHIKEGALNLSKNPILAALTADEQAAINKSYLDNRSYPTRYIKANGVNDPAIEPLDVVAFSGGNIDVGQIINVATQITWKYHGAGIITCASVDEYSEVADGVSTQGENSDFIVASIDELNDAALVAETSATAEETDAVIRLQPKSQLQKQVDGLWGALKNAGGGDATRLVRKYIRSSTGQTMISGAVTPGYNGTLSFHSFSDGTEATDKTIGSFEARDGYFFLDWLNASGKNITAVSFEAGGNIVLQGMNGMKLTLRQNFPAIILNCPAGSVSLELNETTGTGTILIGKHRLSLEDDGLYYDGNKIG